MRFEFLRRFRYTITFGIVVLLATVLIGFNLAFTFGGAGADKAKDLAVDKAGFTSVTSVRTKTFSKCHKNYAAYKVIGYRDDEKVETTACVTRWSWGSYIY